MDTKTLVSKLAILLGRDVSDIDRDISCLAEIIAESMQNDDALNIPGFGAFEPKLKMERVSVHPATGVRLLVPPKLTVAFKPSAILKQKVR